MVRARAPTNCTSFNAAPSTTRSGEIHGMNRIEFRTFKLHPLWKNVTGVSLSRRVGAPVITAVATSERNSLEAELVTERRLLAEQLRMGSFSEDGISYKEKFIVRSYEVGINKTATIETIAKLLQEVVCNRNQKLGFSTDGFGTTFTMRKLNLIWIISRMHIQIYKYPSWNQVVEIEMWSYGEGRIRTRGDWIIKDFANGEIIAKATSKWVMINKDTRRIEKVSGDVRDEYLVLFPETPRSAFPKDNNLSMKTIPKLDDPAQFSKLGLVPRRSDFDMNRHVNNVTYISWFLESMPQEVIDTHELQSITLDYRHECQQGDIVDSLTSTEPIDEGIVSEIEGSSNGASGSKSFCQFLHLLRLSHVSGLEINRGRTVWRKK